MTYRPYLDGLRAIAVLSVVLFHADVPGVPGGFVGVDIFFVISGYLITELLLRELAQTGGISIANFVERRIRRLAPALTLVLLATLIAGIVWLSPIRGEQQGLANSALATILLSANFYFLRHTGGYFDAPDRSFPLLHTWTLSVEEQFYLAWPWLLLAAGVWCRRRKTSLSSAVSLVLAMVALLSFAACAWLTRSHQSQAFFLTPFRAWEFAAGGAVVLLLQWRRVPNFGARAIALLGLAAIIASIAMFDARMAFPGWIALAPVLGSAALIYGCELDSAGLIAKLLALRPMVLIGLISYSLYLWHWPLLSIAGIVLLDEVSPGQKLVLCAIAVALAGLTYRYVEQPIRSRRSPLMASRLRTFRSGAALMLSVALVAVGIGAWAKFIWPRSIQNQTMAKALVALDTSPQDLVSCDQPRPYSGTLVEPIRCALPKTTNAPQILVWGDSHAYHLKDMMLAYAIGHHVQARVRFMAGCPPLRGFDPDLQVRNGAVGCPRYNEDVLKEISVLKRSGLRTVVIAARWSTYSADEKTWLAVSNALAATVSALDALGVRTLVVAPLPSFSRPVPNCLLRRGLSECGTPRSEAEADRRNVMAVLQAIPAQYANTRIVDPLPALCDDEVCAPLQHGEVLFHDDNHLSYLGSRALLPVFTPALDWGMAVSRPVPGAGSR